MTSGSRRRLELEITHVVLHAEARLSDEQLATAAGIGLARLDELVQLGFIEPASPGSREFTAATAARLKRMLRLEEDLGLDLDSAAIIAELLERLERLESELDRLRGAR